mmetsp:Transcript_33575/g.43104  ORF Transcript_33575/g.43104 Transcript_33575/m.43104 type:complete len:94 (+) Transcript_33575:1760-2041(+)
MILQTMFCTHWASLPRNFQRFMTSFRCMCKKLALASQLVLPNPSALPLRGLRVQGLMEVRRAQEILLDITGGIDLHKGEREREGHNRWLILEF